MKKFLLSIAMLAAVAFAMPQTASAYSEQMAQIAQMINTELQKEGDDTISAISYDGDNLVFTLKTGLDGLSQDLFKGVFIENFKNEGGAEFVQVMEAFNVNLKVVVPDGDSTYEFIVTPADLK